MIDIINTKLYKSGDDVYFIISSIDKPHLYIKCYGTIKSRISKEDSVLYGIRLRRVYCNKEVAKTKIHRRVFRTRKNDGDYAVSKTIYCLEFLNEDNVDTLSMGLSEMLKHYQFIVPSVFICEDMYEVNDLYERVKEKTKEQINKMLYEIDND